MNHIIGDPTELGWTAAKAMLLFLTAVAGFRVAERRTLAQMSPFDFVAAVAVGAIIGRVPNASDASYAAGAVTLVTILVAHSVLTRLRRIPAITTLVDHTPRLLVAHGQVLTGEMKRSGFITADLYALLRSQNICDLSQVRYVIIEQSGAMSVIREAGAGSEGDGDVLQGLLQRAKDGQ